MHPIQQKMLALSSKHNLGNMTFRKIGNLVGVDHPQLVKHHLNQLLKRGLIKTKDGGKIIEAVKKGVESDFNLINIPLYGSANCGPATLIADQRLEGFLKVSSNILKSTYDVFALKAVGNSMNRANVDGETIEDGDYLLIKGGGIPKNNDYIVTVIDGMANVKKFIDNRASGQIILMSESSEELPPIFLTPADNFTINGKVLQVIKKPY